MSRSTSGRFSGSMRTSFVGGMRAAASCGCITSSAKRRRASSCAHGSRLPSRPGVKSHASIRTDAGPTLCGGNAAPTSRLGLLLFNSVRLLRFSGLRVLLFAGLGLLFAVARSILRFAFDFALLLFQRVLVARDDLAAFDPAAPPFELIELVLALHLDPALEAVEVGADG